MRPRRRRRLSSSGSSRPTAASSDPFVLVVEGSIPNEELKSEGYWCGFGNNPSTDQPMTTSEWLDRLGAEGHRRGGRRHLRHLRRHPRHGRATRPAPWACPTTSAGTGSARPASRSCASPAARSSPTTCPRRSRYLLYQASGQAPMIPLDEALRPTWLFGATVHEGCDRAGYYEQGEFATEYGSPKCMVKLGCWGPVVKCNVPKRGWIERHRRLPQRRRHLHRLHHARASRTSSCRSWTSRPAARSRPRASRRCTGR